MSNSTTSDFLDKLSSLKNDFKVYVPSIKKDVVAKPITLKQQKDIISTAVNGVLGALQFTEAINNIILENVEGDQFYAFDTKYNGIEDMESNTNGYNLIRELGGRSKYKSNITVEYEDGSFCNFVGRIRHTFAQACRNHRMKTVKNRLL